MALQTDGSGRKDTFMFFSFIELRRQQECNDSGIESIDNCEDQRRKQRETAIVISDSEDETEEVIKIEPEYEFLCEVEFEDGRPIPLPIEQKIECKIEEEDECITPTVLQQSVRPLSPSYNSSTASASECNSTAISESNISTLPQSSVFNAFANLYENDCEANNYIIFVCPQCGENFYSAESWRQHTDAAHNLSSQQNFDFTPLSNNRFECNKCSSVLTRCTLKTLQQHCFTHMPHKVYKCKMCGAFEAHSMYLMISHIMLHKDREELQSSSIMPKSSAGTLNLTLSSLELECRTFMDYICPVCGLSFDDKDCWEAHINFSHNFLEKTAENRYKDHFRCSECEMEIFSQHIVDLQQHLFTHMPHKNYLKCKICGWSIANRNFMLGHIVNLHKSRLHAVAGIDDELLLESLYNDANVSLLEAPNSLHTSPMLTAPVQNSRAAAAAEKITTRQSMLQRLSQKRKSIDSQNLLTPLEQQEHAAARLAAETPTPSSIKRACNDSNTNLLKRNESCSSDEDFGMHRGYKRTGFRCSGCKRGFKTAALRNAHNLEAHSKYQCNVCHAKFALKTHMTRHRCFENQTFECTQCDQVFVHFRRYTKHVKYCAAKQA